MNDYTYNDTSWGIGKVITSWWTLLALCVGTYVGAWFTWGNDNPTSVPTKCVTVIGAYDMVGYGEWVDSLGGWVDYDGQTHTWRDASGKVVATSSAEDSDICSFVK